MRAAIAITAVVLAGLFAFPVREALSPSSDQGPLDASGEILLMRNATAGFDRFLTDSTPQQREWMAERYWRMRGYDPFFTEAGALEWAPPTHLYEDIYALYRDLPEYQKVMQQHPEWILRDAAGNRLFIPADCNGQTCTQYAADFGNPDYRDWWIGSLKAKLEQGYAGVFVDDVNMDITVSDGAGRPMSPFDPQTGEPIPIGDWRQRMASFTEVIAATFPDYEIVHNAPWFADRRDPLVQRQIVAADFIELERGFSDPGLAGGSGPDSFEAFLSHVDWLHALGKPVILEPYDLNPDLQELEIAAYFLTQASDDAIAAEYRADPDNFSPAWNVELGPARGQRYRWRGLWRRDFERGFVLVNPPGEPTATVSTNRWLGLDGEPAGELTLPARRGAVLLADREALGDAPAAPPG